MNPERRALTCHPDCNMCIYVVWSLNGDGNVVLVDGLEEVMNQPAISLCVASVSLKRVRQVKSAGLSLRTGVSRRNGSRWTGVAHVRRDLDLEGKPRRVRFPAVEGDVTRRGSKQARRLRFVPWLRTHAATTTVERFISTHT